MEHLSRQRDPWGRGSYSNIYIPKPEALKDIPRRFRRYGKPREAFQDYLKTEFFDAVLIQTMMTYWYPGIREVIEDVRKYRPEAKIILAQAATYVTERFLASL